MAEHGSSSGGTAGQREEGVRSAPVGRWGSYAAMGPVSPRPGSGAARLFFFDAPCEGSPQHFLDACFLCKKPLGRNRDIFMYRGDTPFCSEECRQEQIEIDEAREKSFAISVKVASSRKEKQKQTDKVASQGIEVRAAGAVLAV
ncbi:unnamed protein product [Spirodela intermedia]|uniref:FLZ-type domain-containing protein n=1 Tax=Spirodela intermedia TaxID=51605 RepID=A0A7I8K6X0_SPIIN|nr:unnamed protein product [Spirodela intermedia]